VRNRGSAYSAAANAREETFAVRLPDWNDHVKGDSPKARASGGFTLGGLLGAGSPRASSGGASADAASAGRAAGSGATATPSPTGRAEGRFRETTKRIWDAPAPTTPRGRRFKELNSTQHSLRKKQLRTARISYSSHALIDGGGGDGAGRRAPLAQSQVMRAADVAGRQEVLRREQAEESAAAGTAR
jgi:hypothetical protein